MHTKKVIATLFIGAVAGAMLGILLAPDKGSETRKKISRKGSDIADDLKNRVKDLISSGDENSGLAFAGNERFDAFKESANHSFH